MISASPITRLTAFYREGFDRVELTWSVSYLLPEAVTSFDVVRDGTVIDTVSDPALRLYVDPDGAPDMEYQIEAYSDSDVYPLSEIATATADLVPMCLVEGTVIGLDGSPLVGAKVYAAAIEPQSKDNGVWTGLDVGVEVAADASGFFSIPLPQGVRVRIRIPDARVSDNILVPDAGQALLTEIAARRNDYVV